MKALAVFPSSREVRFIDMHEPAIAGPTDVKLRILEAGICGTDREITSFQYGTPPANSPHLVIGHEALGEVVEVGSGVTGLTPGDLAVLMVRRPCPHDGCAPCRRGRPDFCITGDFTERGIKGAHGYMTEIVVDDQRYVVKVPKELRQVAVLLEPLTVAEKAAEQVRALAARLPGELKNDPEQHPRSRSRSGTYRAVGRDETGECRRSHVGVLQGQRRQPECEDRVLNRHPVHFLGGAFTFRTGEDGRPHQCGV